MALEVAKTILATLGGNRFVAMTGAKHMLGDASELTFKLPGGNFSNGVNFVRIRLEASDTYTVEFWKIGRAPSFKMTEIAKAEGVYSDALRAVFERHTGLATSLGTMGGA